MAADVSTLVRLLSRYDRADGGGGGGGGEEGITKPDLVTRDLLGGCCVVGGGGGGALQSGGHPKKVAFPDLQLLPAGEKRIQSMDLNLPPLWSSAPLPPVRATALENSAPTLDLRLRSLVPPPPPAEYQSVCTLEKVKSALERAERETRRRQQRDPPAQPRRVPASSASPTSSSTTTSSAKRRFGEGGVGVEDGEGESGSPLAVEAGVAKGEGGNNTADPAVEMAAAGCPSCLMYVLVSRSNPRCPRCSSAVPLPPPPTTTEKKPRIDLNAASAPAPSSSPIRTVKFF